MSRVIMALGPEIDEPSLIRAASSCGVQVVRRCVDAVDLLAAAQIEPDLAVVCSRGVPRLISTHLRELMRNGRTVIGLVQHDEQAAELASWGVQRWVSAQGHAETTMRLIAEMLSGVSATGVWQVEYPPRPAGTIIGVTGAHGAPGRTSVAIGIGRALRTADTCVIDADLIAPAMAMRLGVIDEVSGFMLALRHLEHGSLRTSTLRAATQRTPHGFSVLTGISDPDFRRHVLPDQRDTVLQHAAQVFTWAVVDAGPSTCIGDVTVIVVRAEPLCMVRTVEFLRSTPCRDPIVAVNGRRRDLGAVRTALATQGWDVPIALATSRDLISLVRARQGEGRTTTLSPIFDHS